MVTGYSVLCRILAEAHEQAARGKGHERHATDAPWEGQPICGELWLQRHPGFAIGQARKKALEAMRLPHDAAKAECLGAIVYLAAAAYWFEYEHNQSVEDFVEREKPR